MVTENQQLLIDSLALTRHPCWRSDDAASAGGYEVSTTVAARIVSQARRLNVPVAEVVATIVEASSQAGVPLPPRWDQYFEAYDGNIQVTATADEFMDLWLQSGFARLQLSHKLAAAIAFSTPITTDLHAPWKAWSLVIPDGFFADVEVNLGPGHASRFDLKRAWFIGTELIGVIAQTSDTSVVVWREGLRAGVMNPGLVELINNMAMCALLIMQVRPAKQSGSWGTLRAKANEKRLLAPAVGANYQLSAPIKVDLSADLRRATTGVSRTSSLPKAYWIVRGHPRRVPYGPKHSLRRLQWIEPYPKGDPELRVLMRTTIIE